MLENIKPTLLMGPGPSSVSPSVYNAISTPTIGHLDPRFIGVMGGIKSMLKELFNTQNEFCTAVSGTGSAAMESCFVNLINPGDKVLIVQNGFFSKRMENMCERLGADIDLINFDWGKPAISDVVGKQIQADNYDIVAVVHAETSTGVRNPINEISQYITDDIFFIVDAVTSLGTIELNVDEWNIDAVYSCSQKGLSCPPGASPVTFSEKALNKMKNRKHQIPNWYLDMTELIKYWDGQTRAYHHTAPINMMYGVYQGISDVLEEGLQNTLNRHKEVHNYLVECLNELGLEFLVEKDYRLPSLNSVLIPDGVDDLSVRSQLLNNHQIEIGAGLGPFAGKIWRIGLMGHSAYKENVDKLTDSLKKIL